MSADKKRVVFDTSGINRLLKASDGKSVIERLRDEYWVLITETSVFEVSETSNREERKRVKRNNIRE